MIQVMRVSVCNCRVTRGVMREVMRGRLQRFVMLCAASPLCSFIMRGVMRGDTGYARSYARSFGTLCHVMRGLPSGLFYYARGYARGYARRPRLCAEAPEYRAGVC